MTDLPALMSEELVRDQLGGIGRTIYYELLKSGELRSVKIGSRRFVTADALREYVSKLDLG